MAGGTIRTERLLLRPWREQDRAPFAALNADPVVMEHFPAPLDRAASDSFVDRVMNHFATRGWGLWALEIPDDADFVGFCGLWPATFDAPFTPCVEIGWRMAKEHWGSGYATEAARAALSYGFVELGLDEIVSFTYVGNVRSRRVMEKIGLEERFEFDHPNLPGSRVERHVLYARDAANQTDDTRSR